MRQTRRSGLRHYDIDAPGRVDGRDYTGCMGRSVVITTPIPTADEMAKRLGMGKKRVATIREIVHKNSAKFVNRSKSVSSLRKRKVEAREELAS